MYLEPSIFGRQQCPGNELFYRCSGFTGCCSVNPCTSGCPDNVAAPGVPSTTTPAAAAPPAASTLPVSMAFSTIVAPSGALPSLLPSGTGSGSSLVSPVPADGSLGGSTLPAPAPPQDAGISRAAIGGIVAGIIVMLQVVAVLLFLYYRRKKLRRPKISSPVLLKTGKSVESFSSDGSPTSDGSKDPLKRGMTTRVVARFDGQEDKWTLFDPSKRQSSRYSTGSADISPVSGWSSMEAAERAARDQDRDRDANQDPQDQERGPSPLSSNPVRLPEMDGSAASRPAELESPVEPAFGPAATAIGTAVTTSTPTPTPTPQPPRDPQSLQSSQRANSRRLSLQRAARSLSPISEASDSPRATLKATSKERRMNKYVTDWSSFEPTSPAATEGPETRGQERG